MLKVLILNIVAGQVLAIDAKAALRSNALALAEGRRRPPAGALVRQLDFLVHGVDLLECEALGLVDEEVGERNAQEAAAEPDEEDLALQVGVAFAVVDQVRSAVSNRPVQEPLS
jgi:hypothetical protein